MESFINALARSQDTTAKDGQAPTQIAPIQFEQRILSLSPLTLKNNRVVSFDALDDMTRAFDVLRNMCTRDLKVRSHERPVFGVSSPSLGCGASTTAANLAFSLARSKAGKVLLADLEPSGEGWWRRLGAGIEGGGQKHETIVTLEVAGTSIHAASLLPVVVGKSGSEIKRAVRSWIYQIQRQLGPVSIVLDLPPLLSDDRVSSFIPELDLMLLVLATGRSTTAELETCKTYLHDAASVQMVLNKALAYDF